MKAVRIHERAGAEALVVEEAPYPKAAENDVIVRVHAASFTPGELDWPGTWEDRAGRDRTPVIPGHEVSGEVAELGYGTTGLTVGQRVFGLTDWTRDGTLAEYVAVEARNLAPLPAAVDHVTAAALPMAGLTARQALFDHGGLRAGQTVLVHGAGGAVGHVAVQLAREAGAVVVGTGRERDRAAVLEAGAERFVTLDGRFEEEVGQVDVVMDVIGGDILDRSAAVVRAGGTLVTISAPPKVRPVDGRAVFFVVEADRRQLEELAGWVREGRLVPRVGSVRPLDETRDAFLGKGRVPGKSVVRVVE
ncbi:NADP-dependent oxidoreductase [Streptomyces sp. AV19]|uniref:NADP-dependent oxidoreductase n=1 Tax=Streptomyces sp. AV19 TaxID=2793068 RepID=UPI0018FEE818|nr:NADP-dependent oxidoreductase [Streptomyces sp. AV19]MBH1933843.1 NADP-dependent oxidoreductase [Streptomyces sp. AV19]MDG4533194.1 NADP-dependent oxidoreductase [Streptomyces sp. AV19]